jgi:hypothetical protein
MPKRSSRDVYVYFDNDAKVARPSMRKPWSNAYAN